MHDCGIEKHDAVVSRFDDLEGFGGDELAIAQLVIVDAQLAAGESLGVAVEVIYVRKNALDRPVVSRVGVRLEVAAVNVCRDLAIDFADREGAYAQLLHDLRHDRPDLSEHQLRDLVRSRDHQ